VTIELLNDAMFLLEGHVMHYDETTTPLRQLYFVVQTMLMDPLNADNTRALFRHIFNATVESFHNEAIIGGLKVVETLVNSNRPFEALRAIRSLYPLEAAVLPESGKAPAVAAA